MVVLVIGTPLTGFEFIGPFPNEDAAVEYGERHSGDVEWWVITVQAPEAEV